MERKRTISDGQMGFRRGMGAMDSIYVLNYLMNREISKGKGEMVTFFVNLKAAFSG